MVHSKSPIKRLSVVTATKRAWWYARSKASVRPEALVNLDTPWLQPTLQGYPTASAEPAFPLGTQHNTTRHKTAQVQHSLHHNAMQLSI